ncbi:MAG: BtpA/SgcQ family protein [Lachnospiraceae bacterium]|nr:BtpA/SgcQ family protein [Lachnospiraceae bacterium]
MLDFKTKPIIAMLHMKSGKGKNALLRMQIETDIYIKNGVDAVLVENYFGDMKDCEQGLAWLQKNRPDVCYGVNILGRYEHAFYLADQYDADFIQIDSVCGNLRPKQDAVYEEELNYMREKYPHIQVLGGVRFKYQPLRSGRTLKEDLEISRKRCTAVVTTGDGTGIMTPTEKLIEFRELLGDFPLVVGAGVTDKNVEEQLQYADAVIIGSWLKENHMAGNDVSEEYVQRFMQQVKKCRP